MNYNAQIPHFAWRQEVSHRIRLMGSLNAKRRTLPDRHRHCKRPTVPAEREQWSTGSAKSTVARY